MSFEKVYFEKELNIFGYLAILFLFNTVILRNAQNWPLQEYCITLLKKCKLACCNGSEHGISVLALNLI